MLERLALALLIGGLIGHWLAKRNEPEPDDEAYADFETMMSALPEYLVLGIHEHFAGQEREMLTLTPIYREEW